MYEHMHISHPEKCNKTIGHKQWQCEYCKSIFKNRKKLFEHYRACNIKLSLPKDSKGRRGPAIFGRFPSVKNTG